MRARYAVRQLLAVLALGISLLAQVPKDHPRIPPFPGYAAEDGKQTDFDGYDFDLGNEQSKHAEGKSWHFTYSLQDGKRMASPLELLRNYGNAFKAHGGRVVMSNMTNGGGEATLMMPNGNSETWMHLSVSNDGGIYMVDIIEAAAMEQKITVSMM